MAEPRLAAPDGTATPPDVSVIVCTHNRRERLLRACGALSRQDFPAPQYEVIVVANGCTDGTIEGMKEFERATPIAFRWISEGKLGRSYALNAGSAAARGQILAFTDDDGEARPDRLRTLATSFDDPHVGVAGGPVPVHFPEEVMTDAERVFLAERFLSSYDKGSRRRDLHGVESPIGCNMAVRAEALHRVGGFSPLLGVVGTGGGCYEETEVTWRIRDCGYRVTYDPAAIVDHYPDVTRLSRAAIRSRAVPAGRCRYLARSRSPVSLQRKCLRTLEVSIEIILRALAWVFVLPFSRARFRSEIRLRCSLGKLAGVWMPRC